MSNQYKTVITDEKSLSIKTTIKFSINLILVAILTLRFGDGLPSAIAHL
ncbi:hypothetical protein ACFL50_05015 [Candidatus Latescibacterota bacterium]